METDFLKLQEAMFGISEFRRDPIVPGGLNLSLRLTSRKSSCITLDDQLSDPSFEAMISMNQRLEHLPSMRPVVDSIPTNSSDCGRD